MAWPFRKFLSAYSPAKFGGAFGTGVGLGVGDAPGSAKASAQRTNERAPSEKANCRCFMLPVLAGAIQDGEPNMNETPMYPSRGKIEVIE